MSDDLLPCPFCAATPKLWIGLSEFYDGEVLCICGAGGGNHPTGAEAVAFWNRRALPAVPPDADLVEAACIAAHDAYEAAAKESGWATNLQSRKPWVEVPEANKAAMRAGIGAALALPAVQPDAAAIREAALREAAGAAWAVEGGDRWTRSAAQSAILNLIGDKNANA